MWARSGGKWSLKSEQCLCMAFSEDVTSRSLTRLPVPSAGDGRKEEEKPRGVGWGAELHRSHAALTPKVLQINSVSQNILSLVLN